MAKYTYDRAEDEEWADSDSDEELESLISNDARKDPKEHMKQAAAEAYEGLERLEQIKKYMNIIALSLTGFAVCFLTFFVAHDHLQQKPLIKVSGLNLVDSLNHDSFVDHDYDEILPIQRIVLLGERNSGLEELTYRLSRCYPDIDVTTYFTRYGYWFQDTKDKHEIEPLTLVIGVFLNVYDWVDLMRQNPLHAPNHEAMNWQTFVQTPWTMNPPMSDLEESDIGKKCQQNFGYGEVVPCEVNTYQAKYPVYEMKPGGTDVIANILELRDEKIRNFVSTMYMKQVQSFISIKFEDLMLSGVFDLLGRIELASGLCSSCSEEAHVQLKLPLFTPTIDASYTSYITEHVDWGTERMIGYKAEEAYDHDHSADGITDNSKTNDVLNPYDIVESKAEVMIKPSEVNDHLLDTLEQTDDISDLATNIQAIPTQGIGWNDNYITDLDSSLMNDYFTDSQAADSAHGKIDTDFVMDDDITDLDSPLMNDYFSDLEEVKLQYFSNNLLDPIDDIPDMVMVKPGEVNDHILIPTQGIGLDDVYITDLDSSLMNDYFTDSPADSLAADSAHGKIDTDVEMDDVITDLDSLLMNDYFSDLEEVSSHSDLDTNTQDMNMKDTSNQDMTNQWDIDIDFGTDDFITDLDTPLMDDYTAKLEKGNSYDEKEKKDITVTNLDGLHSDLDTNTQDLTTHWEDTYINMKEKHKPEVQRIVLLVERNSGLSWFYSKIFNCYPQLEVSTSLVRPGFLFQTPQQSLDVPTVVLSLVVHPYIWVELMRRNPEYAPHHKDLPWQDFVSSPWNTPSNEKEENLSLDVKCQYGFSTNYVKPCISKLAFVEEDNPCYELELNGSGHAYSSIIDLRADKIVNHLRTATWGNVTSFLTVNYETLMRPGEFHNLLSSIDNDTGGTLNSHCDTTDIADYIAPSLTGNKDYDSDYEYVKWMDDNLDWDIEHMIGYHLDSY